MTETVGRFQLLESLGVGTLGELHRARDLERGRTVALRILAPALVQDEARLTALLKDVDRVSAVSHPGIPTLYEDGQDGDRIFLASEYVPGERLSDLVHGIPLNPKRALDLAVQVADGLAAAHAADLVHGALSTRRVLVTMKGAAKILDVGMLPWTATPAEEHVDDFVGLGELLFEMLVGRPVKRGWPAEVRDEHVPEVVRPVLRQLLAGGTPEQHASMALASAALRDALLRLTAAPASTHVAVAEPPAPKARPSLMLLLAIVVGGAIAWLILN